MIDNFDQLVKRCTARRRKRMIRLSLLIVGTLLLLISGIGGYTMWSSSAPKTVPQPAPLPTASVPEPADSALAAEFNATVTPIPEAPIAKVSAAIPVAAPARVEKNTTTPVKSAPIIAAKPAEAPAAAVQKPQSSRFFEVNTDPKTAPVDPVTAYDKNPKYETALAAARDFFAKKEFADAALWAKKANQMNREGEEAWLLYAKSYYAQGLKKEAIGVLELYLNYKDSKAASELLRTWKQTAQN